MTPVARTDRLRVLPAHATYEGGGFLVHRAFPTPDLPMVDPFLLLDQMGPVDYAPGEAKGAPDHPHRGFETVTYLLDGAMVHEDSNGNRGELRPGDVQWMTAGSGVVHSEMPHPDTLATGGRFHGFQLWVNLPKKDKMMAPRYQDIRSDTIPEVETGGGKVRVIAGRYGDMEAVIDMRVAIQYLHAIVAPGKAILFRVPKGHHGFALVALGGGHIGETAAEAHHVVLLPDDIDLALKAGPDGMSVLLISGAPLREPVARYGPFVMNTTEEIRQAVVDFQAGRMGEIQAEHRKA
ncbi:MAG: pirin family protein [Euryarchaeota archaeon]|nr:pirin family protein [Euryarchaeota archaeon]